MPRARKKPVEVDFEPYRVGLEDGFEYEDQMPADVDIRTLYKHVNGVALYPFIRTLEGRMFISPNDVIITGVAGERYPCKGEIFAATYDVIE